MTESETFRKLKQTPYSELFTHFDITLQDDLVTHLESHNWYLREYLEKVADERATMRLDTYSLVSREEYIKILFDFYTNQHERRRHIP